MFILTCAKPTLPRFLAERAAFEGNSGRDSCRSSNKPRQHFNDRVLRTVGSIAAASTRRDVAAT
jgi:hypothetical protein